MTETIANAGRGARGAKLACIVLALLLLLAAVLGLRSYNEIVASQERAAGAWSQVVSNYQRRRDLVPVLVETVSAYLRHEKDTLTAVTGRRRRQDSDLRRLLDALDSAAGIGASPASPGQLDSAERRLGAAMHGLVAVVEDYPELRSSEHFSMLQSQLEGTENRIHVARLRFNEAAEIYNRTIRRIPGNVVAAVSGFRLKPYFAADEGLGRSAGTNFQ